MEHMVVGLMVSIGKIDMTKSEMAISWIHLIDKAVDMGLTLVLVQTGIMVIIVIILMGEVNSSLLDEIKKEKPPTFDAEMKKSRDAEEWLLGMNNFFRLHDYSESMKARISTFSLKGKANILWEDVKNVRGIEEEELTWSGF